MKLIFDMLLRLMPFSTSPDAFLEVPEDKKYCLCPDCDSLLGMSYFPLTKCGCGFHGEPHRILTRNEAENIFQQSSLTPQHKNMNDKFQVGHVGWSPDYDSNKPRKQHASIEDQALEYAEALNDIADILQLPTGVTSAEIVAAIKIWQNEAEKQLRDLYEVCNQFGGGASISHPRITRQLSAAKKFLNVTAQASPTTTPK